MNSHYLLRTNLHPSQRTPRHWWNQLFEERVPDVNKVWDYVQRGDVEARINRYVGKWWPLRESVSLIYEKDLKVRKYVWELLPKGTEVRVTGIKPNLYLDMAGPKTNTILDVSSVLKSKVPWVFTAVMVEVSTLTHPDRVLMHKASTYKYGTAFGYCRILDLLSALEPAWFEVIESYLAEHLVELFQPRIPKEEFYPLDRSALVGYGIPTQRAMNTTRDIYDNLINYFRSKRYEYNLMLVLGSTGIDFGYVYTSKSPHYASVEIPVEEEKNLKGRTLVTAHSHPSEYTPDTRFDPERWFNDPYFTMAFKQLAPSPTDYKYMHRFAWDFQPRKLTGYIVGPDGCVRFHPLSESDYYSPKYPPKDYASFMLALNSFLREAQRAMIHY